MVNLKCDTIFCTLAFFLPLDQYYKTQNMSGRASACSLLCSISTLDSFASHCTKQSEKLTTGSLLLSGEISFFFFKEVQKVKDTDAWIVIAEGELQPRKPFFFITASTHFVLFCWAEASPLSLLRAHPWTIFLSFSVFTAPPVTNTNSVLF